MSKYDDIQRLKRQQQQLDAAQFVSGKLSAADLMKKNAVFSKDRVKRHVMGSPQVVAGYET